MAINRKTLFITAGVVVLLGVFGVANLRPNRHKKIEVQTERVRSRNIKAVVTASGSIRPKRQVDVSANQMGTVVEIGVAEGDHVEEGDFLLQIDPIQYAQVVEQSKASIASIRAELEQAAIRENHAEREFERIRNLRDQDLASPQELQKSETEFKVAEANRRTLLGRLREREAMLRRGEHDLELSTILAPMSGVVVRLEVEEGETAVIGTMNQPGTVLLTLADLSVLEARVEVDETDVVDIAAGQRAVVSIDCYPDTTFPGTVTEVGNSALRANRQTESVDFEVVITLDDPIPGAKPGLSATADVIIADRREVLSVPIQSLTIRAPDDESDEADSGEVEEILDDDPTLQRKADEREGVFIVQDGKAHFVAVETGIAGDRYFEVLSGLEADAEVVSGDFKTVRELKHGDPVKVAKE